MFEEKFKEFFKATDIRNLNGGSLDQILAKAMKPLLTKKINAKPDERLEYCKYEKNLSNNLSNICPSKTIKEFLGNVKLKTPSDMNAAC